MHSHCTIPDCDKPHYARGLCRKHYELRQNHGDRLFTTYIRHSGTPEQRFWLKVDKAGLNGCWLWTGSKSCRSYGHFWTNGKPVSVHRFAYELLVGLIPDGLELDHLCRVRTCVNPEHLEVVSHRENLLRSPLVLATWRNLNDKHRAKTHCPAGHSYTGANLINVQGGRRCRTCKNQRQLKYYFRKRNTPTGNRGGCRITTANV